MQKVIDRLKNNFKENSKVLLIFAVIWALVVGLTINHYADTLGKESIGKQNCESVIELNENVVISQSMTTVDQAESISVKFATYARTNSGNIHITLVGNQSGITYLNTTVPTSSIQDNAFGTYKLYQKIDKSIDNSVSLRLTSDSKEGQAIGVYYGSDKEFGCIDEDTFEERFSMLFINGSYQSTDELGFKYLLTDEAFDSYSKSLIAWAVVGYTLLALILLFIKPKLEIMFSVIIFVFGLIFMSAIVPLSPPDEQLHYEWSFQVSNKIMGEEEYRYINRRYADYSHLYGHYNVSGGYIRFIEDFNEPLDLSSRFEYAKEDIADTYSVCFIPQALGITLARSLGLNMLKTFYTGRMFNLIFFVICIYIALRNAPIHKFLIGFLASLPIFVQAAASYSYDCFVISLCFLLFSFILKWCYSDKNIKPWECIFVFLCCLGLAPIKYVYGFIPVLFFFVPKKKFKNNIWLKIVAVLVLIAPSMSLLLPMIFERLFRGFGKLFNSGALDIEINEARNLLSLNGEIDVEKEVVFNTSYVFEHPLETMGIFYRTVRYNIKQWFYNSLGRALSGETLVLPITLVKVIAATTFFVSFRKEENVEKPFFKIFSIALCAGIGLLIMMGMFLSWTESSQVVISDFGGMMVQGVQGRYFCPILPFFFLIFNNKKIAWPKKWDKYIILVLILITFEVFMYILSYTFVN